jgi:hypothetical protein
MIVSSDGSLHLRLSLAFTYIHRCVQLGGDADNDEEVMEDKRRGSHCIYYLC